MKTTDYKWLGSFILVLAILIAVSMIVYLVRRIVYSFNIYLFNVNLGMFFDAIVLPILILIVAGMILLRFHSAKKRK